MVCSCELFSIYTTNRRRGATTAVDEEHEVASTRRKGATEPVDRHQTGSEEHADERNAGISFISLLKRFGLNAEEADRSYRLTSSSDVYNGIIRHFRKDRLAMEEFVSGNPLGSNMHRNAPDY